MPGSVARQFPPNYTHVRSDLTVKVLGREFTIPGSYFVQENGIDCVCAQSCVKMSMIHVDGNRTQREPPTSGEINASVAARRKAAGRDDFDPRTGLTIKDLEKVIRDQAAVPLILDMKAGDAPKQPYEWAYLLIESGIPALVAFCPEADETEEGDEDILHVMPVVGHTLNSDKWLPLAQIYYERFDSGVDRDLHPYRSTAEWACHLVIHDDVLGPYYCMSQHDLLYPPDADGHASSKIRYVVGIVPAKAGFTMPPYVAQQFASIVFWAHHHEFVSHLPEPWRGRFLDRPFTPQTLVIRTQLVERSRYLSHLTTAKDHMGCAASMTSKEERKLKSVLPEKFWLTEFSLAETYSVNHDAFGEILLDFNPSRADLYRAADEDVGICIAMRFMNRIKIRGERHLDLGFTSHTPLFTREKIGVAYQ